MKAGLVYSAWLGAGVVGVLALCGEPVVAGERGGSPYSALLALEEARYGKAAPTSPSPEALTAETSASGYTANTSATECAECHMTEYLQWDQGQNGHLFPVDVFTGGQRYGSVHRLAFLDETFHKHYIENDSPDSCLRCHVPTTVYSVDRSRGVYAPTSRTLTSNNALEGITCVSCHLDAAGYIRGEHDYSLEEADHEVLADDEMFKDGNTLCQSCHGDPFFGALSNTWKQWNEQARSSGQTCVDCHMTNLDDFTSVSHAFPGAHSGTMIKQAIRLEFPAEIDEDDAFVVEACNDFAGHNLPTGDQFRAYVLTVDVRNSSGSGFTMEKWISPLFKTPIMKEIVEYDRVDPIPFLTCRDMSFTTLRDGTYTVHYTLGFWLLKPTTVDNYLPNQPDLVSEGEVYQPLLDETLSLRVVKK